MFENSNPLVIVYFTVNTTTTNEAGVRSTVENVRTINYTLIVKYLRCKYVYTYVVARI